MNGDVVEGSFIRMLDGLSSETRQSIGRSLVKLIETPKDLRSQRTGRGARKNKKARASMAGAGARHGMVIFKNRV